MKRILILGPVPQEGKAETFGGATILMQSFLNFLETAVIPHKLIEQNHYRGRFAPVLNYLKVIADLLKNIKEFDLVMINVSVNGAFFLSPAIYFLTRLHKKKFAFRIFGSNLEKKNNQRNFLTRRIFKKTIQGADLLIGETMVNLAFFQKYSSFTYWLPNLRPRCQSKWIKKSYNKKFVFISQITKEKGIFEIMEAFEMLPPEFLMDVYGPVKDKKFLSAKINNTRINYRGVLEPGEVRSTLSNYDVLLLPTYYEGEGHPGIIIEAMSLGIPSIATRWNSIPEVITDGKDGILVPIKNSEALIEAILTFNDSNYSFYSQNAFERFDFFSEEEKYRELILNLNNL